MTISEKNHELTLYQFDSCPFCIKVNHYLIQNNISIPTKNTMTDPDAKSKLMKIGGKTQVPCLVIDGKALYESDDIINWFEQNYSEQNYS
jgi:glutaredoxin 3